jgi:hypothetical protein
VTVAWPGRRAGIALGFALAALFACWSPLAAPFGLLTGLGAAVLAWRARSDGLRPALLALGLALLAVAGSSWILARTTGVWRSPGDVPLVPTAGERETSRRLDKAAAESAGERRQAAEQASPAVAPHPRN